MCALSLDVFEQCGVDEALIISASRFINESSEPVDDLVVETDRDACLAARRRHDGPAPASAEVVLSTHWLSLVSLVVSALPPCRAGAQR